MIGEVLFFADCVFVKGKIDKGVADQVWEKAARRVREILELPEQVMFGMSSPVHDKATGMTGFCFVEGGCEEDSETERTTGTLSQIVECAKECFIEELMDYYAVSDSDRSQILAS